ncbi:MAG: hypothetical protein M3220_13240, partial [Chloroflexota bacterium]|nr:hypothetical protein [Chloroflexota bacterium]
MTNIQWSLQASNLITADQKVAQMRDGDVSRRSEEPRVRLEPGFEAEWPGASALATECILNLTYLVERMEAYAQSLAQAYGIPSLAAFN